MSTSSLVFGDSRTYVGSRHALIAPDGHVPSSWPGIDKVTVIVLISRAIGARFTQILLTFQPEGVAAFPSNNTEAFAYVLRGSVGAEVSGKRHMLETGSYLFVPAGQAWKLEGASEGAQVNLFFKRYVALDGAVPPEMVVGHESQVVGQPFLGREEARLQTLLSVDFSFDMAVNIFNFSSGAFLPFVETHIMEHGLLMLEGTGVYRLEDRWYPVAAGDCLWMAPYCPQWFTAMGKTPARYLYYKDVNRPVLP
jgi:(S)-ureidoglycine aminohydrolase